MESVCKVRRLQPPYLFLIKTLNSQRKEAWKDFFLSIAYVAVWIAFSIWTPYNKRHYYDFSTNEDRLRISLFIIGIIFAIYLVIAEIKEVYNDYMYQKVFSPNISHILIMTTVFL
jgi:hypothetical protein